MKNIIKPIGMALLIIAVILFTLYCVFPSKFMEISSMILGGNYGEVEAMDENSCIYEETYTLDYENYNNEQARWNSYKPYEGLINAVFEKDYSKYVWVDCGSIDAGGSGSMLSITETVTAKVYNIEKDDLKQKLKSINEKWILDYPEHAYMQKIITTDINKLENCYVETIMNLTNGPGTSGYSSLEGFPIDCFNGEKIKGDKVEDTGRYFEDYGLKLDCNNVKVDKLIVFSNSRTIGIVSADITTLTKTNKALDLAWVPDEGKTKNISFFVTLYLDPLQGGSEHVFNIDVINY